MKKSQLVACFCFRLNSEWVLWNTIRPGNWIFWVTLERLFPGDAFVFIDCGPHLEFQCFSSSSIKMKGNIWIFNNKITFFDILKILVIMIKNALDHKSQPIFHTAQDFFTEWKRTKNQYKTISCTGHVHTR